MSNDTFTVSTKYKDGIPSGTYPAVLRDLTTEEAKDYGFGVQDFFHFDFDVEGPERDVRISAMTTQKYSAKAKAAAILAALLGRPVKDGEEVSRKALIGTRVLVAVTLDDVTGYNKITAVLPAPATSRRKSEVPA